MATTTPTRTGNFISLYFPDAGADYLYSTDTVGNPGAAPTVRIASIMFQGLSSMDHMIVRDGASDAAVVFQGKYSGLHIKYYGSGKGVVMNPSITVSQCVSLTGCIIIFEIA